MKINVGIVGFGNLGKALANQIENSDLFNLVAIFSRRNLEETIPLEKIIDYKDKIDILFLCSGSQNDLELQASKLIKHFNIIDCYDNHIRLEDYVNKINLLAQKYNHVAMCAFGWDPGLFSLIRGLFSGLGFSPHTFWGKGTSQGHTQAIKQIKGVVDAIQFTIPNNFAIEQIHKGYDFNPTQTHIRECYVVCNENDEERIKNQITSMPHYFKGYETNVHFITQEELNSMKSFSHKGMVTTKNKTLNFYLEMNSNPDFTANIMINFARIIHKLSREKMFGAYTIFDLPINNLLKENKFNFL